MKFLYLSFSVLFLLILSCKSDDESGNSIPNKYVSHIDWSLGEYINFTYNENHTVKSIDVNDDIIFRFEYSDSQIETVIVQFGPGGNSDIYHFTYDENGKIRTIADEEIINVTYNEAEQSYSYPTSDDGDYIKVFLQDDEVKKLVRGGEDEMREYEFNYSPENYGPLAGSNSVNIHILLALPDPLISFIATSFTRKPVDYYSEEDQLFLFNNAFGEDGFIIRRDFEGYNGEPDMDFFEYIQP